ncbi:acetyl-coa acetyltransferase b [Dermatophagoides farinae]|uniref:acetyl-CoA C-acetyltransferase n=1 Tax=Dermatophagoides farinae TaxID=6954 RepID=A0A9D4NR78_DERFA|nr:acetyl-coa acetyltransferase b [Dermatophagoides farinae]
MLKVNRFSIIHLIGKRNLSSTNIKDDQTYIISAARTPIGCFRSKLAQFTGPQLGAIAIQGAIERSTIITKDLIEEVIMGNVRQAGVGQAPARQAALGAGLPVTVATTSLNKACASGMKSYQILAQAIQCGQIDIGIAGGQESFSNVPFFLPRGDLPYGGIKLIDGLQFGFTDVYYKKLMGACAEHTAKNMNISRAEQDDYAKRSYELSAQWASKVTELEIVPVDIPATKKYQTTNLAKMKNIGPVFEPKNGTITAANASKINDGASAAVLASGRAVRKYGLKPLAKIVGFADAAVDPIDFSIAPTYAIPKLLEMTGYKQNDIHLWEINEAFSAVVLANLRLLKIDISKVNIRGGAVSLGHPVGMSGSRIVNHLALHLEPGQMGVAAICNAGGGASALMLEKMYN